MKVENVSFVRVLIIVFAAMNVLMFQSCSDSVTGEENAPGEVRAEELRTFNTSDLEDMKGALSLAGVDLENLDVNAYQQNASNGSTTKAPSVIDFAVRAIKVSTTTKYTDASGVARNIPISGVLLVPRLGFTSLRLVVALEPTYSHNGDAPSNLFKSLSPTNEEGNLNFLYFWTLQATQGFAVLFPDYPGFGDSFQKVFIPYLIEDKMTSSTIDLIKASRDVLKKNWYSYKPELIVAGYSLGAHVATSLTKKLDTSKDFPIKLTVAGGAPLDLVDLIDRTRESTTMSEPLVFPYTMLAYFKNEDNKSFSISDIFKMPYSQEYLENLFDGKHYLGEIVERLPKNISELFTDDFVKNYYNSPKLAPVRDLLKKNSVEPWKNQTPLVLIHGTSDDMVFYDSTRNFYEKQKALGGNITFSPMIGGNHVSTIISFYIEASILLLTNR